MNTKQTLGLCTVLLFALFAAVSQAKPPKAVFNVRQDVDSMDVLADVDADEEEYVDDEDADEDDYVDDEDEAEEYVEEDEAEEDVEEDVEEAEDEAEEDVEEDVEEAEDELEEADPLDGIEEDDEDLAVVEDDDEEVVEDDDEEVVEDDDEEVVEDDDEDGDEFVDDEDDLDELEEDDGIEEADPLDELDEDAGLDDTETDEDDEPFTLDEDEGDGEGDTAPAAAVAEVDPLEKSLSEIALLEEIRRRMFDQHGRESLEEGQRAVQNGSWGLAIEKFQNALEFLQDKESTHGLRQQAYEGLAEAYYRIQVLRRGRKEHSRSPRLHRHHVARLGEAGVPAQEGPRPAGASAGRTAAAPRPPLGPGRLPQAARRFLQAPVCGP